MEHLTNLAASGKERSPEEKLLLAKIVEHVADYVKVVAKYGSDFYIIPGAKAVKGGSGNHRHVVNETLVNGKIARAYFLSDSEYYAEDFLPNCQLLGLNSSVIRKFLGRMTREKAREIWPLFQARKFPRGTWGGNQWTKRRTGQC